MNRKGFTLIELLAVIVLLGLVLIFAVPNFKTIYRNSKLKSEKIFIEKLSDTIDGYIKLNSSGFVFTHDGTANKEGQTSTITIYKGTLKGNSGVRRNLIMNDVIAEKLISESDYVNGGNKDVTCNINAEIEVYKDSDYVYCHKVNKESLGCLTNDYKDSITGDYVIDTCIWSR